MFQTIVDVLYETATKGLEEMPGGHGDLIKMTRIKHTAILEHSLKGLFG